VGPLGGRVGRHRCCFQTQSFEWACLVQRPLESESASTASGSASAPGTCLSFFLRHIETILSQARKLILCATRTARNAQLSSRSSGGGARPCSSDRASASTRHENHQYRYSERNDCILEIRIGGHFTSHCHYSIYTPSLHASTCLPARRATSQTTRLRSHYWVSTRSPRYCSGGIGARRGTRHPHLASYRDDTRLSQP
jgi:hypothetical protein